MFAAFPMYDRPETAAAHDALWADLRDRLRQAGIDAPEALDRDVPYMDGWARDDLLVGQICNLPLRALHCERLTVLGCGDYGLPDCPPGHYHSVLVVRHDDPARTAEEAAGHRLAYNDPMSCSGWGAVWTWAESRGLRLAPHLETGAHADSLAAVAEGRADLAAIDSITWAMLRRWDPAAREVRVVGRTGTSPGQSFVTADPGIAGTLRAALAAAIDGLAPDHRATLGLRGLVRLPSGDYDMALPEAPIRRAA
ncbi:phosphate/phosphite/phosphonate ABC transporter substrate-binding protein [Wenxinia saemankumensis]|uniref:ABC-type phosphate/phosphonate transport system, substrate-binding protein n=1 Tax=Wenxinia saemankumensis TaxID=1447782 RepID=A0A1M6CG57_9RHOB|nr:PhnD/SsuA/transferrin family substrate-binding protein [Wenxinia saemankumensis]SHI59999.1 ABC-type phosphate/phosphonate transport system, substrate-binding protein [Wenxinia saemankumensis]